MPTPLLLILTAAGFGASPLLISLAVQYFPPWTLGALRAALGLPLLLFAAGAFGRHPYPDRQDIVTALVGGVLVIAVPFVSMAAGMQYIPSGLGGILYATMPLFTVLLAAVFLRDEPITALQLSRIAIGLTGVALIALPQFRQEGFGGAGLGTVLTLISPLSYAAGNVWFRRRRAVSPLLLSAGMFAVGMAAVWPLALVIEGRVPVAPSQQVIGVLLALVVLATVAPALLNYMLVRQAGANRAALAMFLMPGFAVVFGMVFLDETLPGMAFGGLALVIVSSLPLPSSARRPVVAAPPEPAPAPSAIPPAAPARALASADKADDQSSSASAPRLGPAGAKTEARKAKDKTGATPAKPKRPATAAAAPATTPQAKPRSETTPADKDAAPGKTARKDKAPKPAAKDEPAATANDGPASSAVTQTGSVAPPADQSAQPAKVRTTEQTKQKKDAQKAQGKKARADDSPGGASAAKPVAAPGQAPPSPGTSPAQAETEQAATLGADGSAAPESTASPGDGTHRPAPPQRKKDPPAGKEAPQQRAARPDRKASDNSTS
ncbi:MAG: EamA family transporter [Pararhodobacter sp.]|nr:EamA family transporter [Pararhodobacter sp.]